MASSTLFHILSSLFIFCLASSFSYAAYPNNNQVSLTSTAYLPKLQAEKLIRGLNLFPKSSVNTAAAGDHASVSAPKLVEKQLSLNPLGDPGPSVQEFGHHAGYYTLPHSQSAR